jgi:hypothetical protein
MNILSKRLQRLEQKCLERQVQRSADVKSGEDRLVRGAFAGLTDAELEHLSDFAQAHAVNPDARPNAEQQAALDAFERHYREFQTTGRLQTVRGWPVDDSGQWPKVNGCSVGSYLDVSWWVDGIGYCLDLSPRQSRDDVPPLGSVGGSATNLR